MKLSDRLRDGVEAAQWVIDDVKKLEQELADAYAELRKQRGTVKAVFDAEVWARAEERNNTTMSTPVNPAIFFPATTQEGLDTEVIKRLIRHAEHHRECYDDWYPLEVSWRRAKQKLEALDEMVEALQAARRGLAEAMQPHLVPGLRNEYDLVVAALEKVRGE